MMTCASFKALEHSMGDLVEYLEGIYCSKSYNSIILKDNTSTITSNAKASCDAPKKLKLPCEL
eukprot:4222452-Ditylum_brightwellii.AAC.1